MRILHLLERCRRYRLEYDRQAPPVLEEECYGYLIAHGERLLPLHEHEVVAAWGELDALTGREFELRHVRHARELW
ncbi:hypothetical protein [Chromohalobacter israelensis]